MPSRRILLPWNRPLLPQAVAGLAAGWDGHGPLDLSGLLVVVPTKQAGRRLREALAGHAAQQGQAVFSPRVMSPEMLVVLGAPLGGSATRSEARLAWISVLRAVRTEEFRAVFPLDPPARDFAWARRLADQLLRLQAMLAENALRIGDVPARAGRDFPETERWSQLGELERRYDAALARGGRRDIQAAKIARVDRDLPWPAGVNKIVVLATPDPLPLAIRALEQHATQGPVEVVMYGEDEKMFDAWGRPLTDTWVRREMGWPGIEQNIHLCANPADQAARVVGLAKSYAATEGRLAVGVGDAEALAPLEGGLARAGIAAFNPAGHARKRDALHALLVALADFAREEDLTHTAALARCPDVLAWLEARAEGGMFSPAGMLAELDKLHARHLPATLRSALDHAGKFPQAAFALRALGELHARLTRGEFPDNAAAALAEIFTTRRIEAGSWLAESAEVWRENLQEVGDALRQFPGAPQSEGWELALEAFAAEMRTEEKPAGALELNGWLELLWEDAPQLVVTGLNDGSVPEAVVGDGFLPEALRGRLGLKTNAARLARDAYLLAALAAWRVAAGSGGEPPGRLDLLLGKVSAAGDPLRPSRLLFRCADAALPGRVAWLFREVEAAQASLPWARAWRLRPPRAAPPAKVSVTALRDWLACPFRFYLKHVLQMAPVEPEKAELDALDFGTLVHGALQAMGEDEALRDCTDETTLRTGLLGALERGARAQFGGELTLPLVVQLESARQRLTAAARVQARERAAGWRIERVEWKFQQTFGGLQVRGKIDRIDRHTGTGAYRVLDYKTSDLAVAPEQAHLGPVSDAAAGRPSWMQVRAGDRPRRWLDLQLPLYRRAAAEELGAAVGCGYFNLPKAAGETAVELWDGPTAALQTAAEACAAGVAAAIAAGEFWPPVERDARDDAAWAGLFHHGTAASVEWAGETPAKTREGTP